MASGNQSLCGLLCKEVFLSAPLNLLSSFLTDSSLSPQHVRSQTVCQPLRLSRLIPEGALPRKGLLKSLQPTVSGRDSCSTCCNVQRENVFPNEQKPKFLPNTVTELQTVSASDSLAYRDMMMFSSRGYLSGSEGVLPSTIFKTTDKKLEPENA